jgi:HK97 family phage major capsid protein
MKFSLEQIRSEINKKGLIRNFMPDSKPVVDMANRTAEFSVSSEYPVERWFGNEILDHSSSSIDMSRLMDGASIRDTHFGDQVGVVQKAEITPDRKLRITGKYSQGQRGTDILNDINDGIRKNVSIRYNVNEMQLESESSKDDIDTYRVTNWTPIHVSEEPDGADPTVGHGRSKDNEGEQIIIPIDGTKSLEEQFNLINKKNERNIKILLTNNRSTKTMTPEEEVKLREQYEREMKTKLDDQQKADDLRRDNFISIAKDLQPNLPGLNLRNEVDAFISDRSKTPYDFSRFCMSKLKDPEALRTPLTQIGMSDKEKKSFSMRNVILALVEHRVSTLGVELEASKACAKAIGREPENGLFIPWEIQTRQLTGEQMKYMEEFERTNPLRKNLNRDLSVTEAGGAGGGYTVHYQYIPQSFIEILQNAMITPALGVQIIEGLQGNIPMTRELTKNITYYIAEGNAPTASDYTFGQDMMTPKTMGALTHLTHQFVLQNSIGGEAYALRKIAIAAGLGYDKGVLYGTGPVAQPLGVMNNTGIGGVVGAGFTRPKLLQMIQQIKAANALVLGPIVFAMDPTTEQILSGIDTTNGFGKWLLDLNKLGNYPYFCSNQMQDGDLIGGIWSADLMGMWGVVEVRANELGSGFAAGQIEVRALVDFDNYVEYPGAFSRASGVTAA